MGNSGDQRFETTLKRLADDDDVTVAEAARWAAQQLSKSSFSQE
jgi:hypothetical protein